MTAADRLSRLVGDEHAEVRESDQKCIFGIRRQARVADVCLSLSACATTERATEPIEGCDTIVLADVTYTRFKADKDIMDALVHLRKKRGVGERGETTAGQSVLGTPLFGTCFTLTIPGSSRNPPSS